jgi:hypothetical protein
MRQVIRTYQLEATGSEQTLVLDLFRILFPWKTNKNFT